MDLQGRPTILFDCLHHARGLTPESAWSHFMRQRQIMAPQRLSFASKLGEVSYENDLARYKEQRERNERAKKSEAI